MSKWLNWARRRDAPHVVDAVEIAGAAVPRALMEDLDDCLTRVFGTGTAHPWLGRTEPEFPGTASPRPSWPGTSAGHPNLGAAECNWADGYKPSLDALREEGKL